MILFPAIDIRGGKCVRLLEGRFDQETIFADRPADMAIKWEAQGGKYLHIVDLDGALQGKPVNLDAIRDIIANVSVPVQLGGGIRNLESIEAWLDAGVDRVILGSIAVKDPDLVKEACRQFGERIVVGIDAKGGEVAVEGWGISGGVQATELAKRMADVGVARIIYTDISRDGTLSGVNVESTVELARAAGIPVIASGGVAGMDDVYRVAASPEIEGMIIGKALYTGKIDLKAALCVAEGR
ncbi:MAG: 1-(5-phosphoribosyl)-5-[Selenomonadales bacterium]|nr:1-(5-phosphoribosyl)-5-[(5-phosphoribosylamino)methylideneamino]imidazole-4-carboxamide isomerase [Selenomonadales bacterium]MBQ5636150.1 1-(5-phosphoribosyl)-5-[(5-phosphoribosylamino)methylideneamino]imidazole-4-carboxamide isomerase [Selenomonadales bacterium]MBQ5745432.1 1-(5-phosphoribosyl)-5-[(5-phosphoribosylamino)methylideneamino]imidazole-4-carboxamide isomerase [Selenomonadales bacterium]MBQ5832685.1 1-(5-phosphoribosyl)-5-[(5-phosphoribosylamino)methylideneamino]imidazole-4-carboxa